MTTPSRKILVLDADAHLFPRLRALVFLGALGVAMGGHLNAQSTWSTTTTGTTWNVAANWVPAVLPASGATLVFGATATAGTLLNNQLTTIGTITFSASAPSYTINTTESSFSFSGASTTVASVTNNDAGTTDTLSGSMSNMENGDIITAGAGNVIFSGFVLGGNSGTNLYAFDAALTTFSGTLDPSNSGGGRVVPFGGTGNILISGLLQPSATSTALTTLEYEGSGTLELSNANGGSITGTNTTTGSMALVVGTGATVVSGTVGAVSTLLVNSNYTIGTAGVVDTTITGTSVNNSGALSMVNGSINTLNLNSTQAVASTILTVGNSAPISLEVGATGADEIIVGSGTQKASFGVNIPINIVGLGGLSGTTQTLIYSGGATAFTIGSSITSGSNFFLNSASGNFGGYTVALTSGTSANALLTGSTSTSLFLTETAIAAPVGNVYWTGTQASGSWNAFSGGNANNSNWSTTPAGTSDPHSLPGSSNDVYFSASNATTNFNTTLGQAFSIQGLFFTNVGSAVTINGGTNTLTVGTDGINVQTGSPNPTINANVALGGNQSWTINSGQVLSVTGTISGAHNLTMTGTGGSAGELLLGGANTFSGSLTINSNALVETNGAGALTSSDSVAFGSSSSGTLDLNGFSQTIGSLSSISGGGSAPVIQNNSLSSAATLAVTQSTSGTFFGVMQNGGGGLSMGFIKAGGASLTLAGANTYTGSTNVNGGLLNIQGSLGSGTVSVNTGTLAGSGTIGGSVTVTSTGEITSTVGTGATSGTLTLSSGLTIVSGGIAAFNIATNGSANDEINLSGSLTLNNGVILQVTSGITQTGSYAIMTFGSSNLADGTVTGVTEENLSGGPLGGNYSFVVNSGTLDLVVAPSLKAVPGISIILPTNNSRAMVNTVLALSGSVSNSGTANALSGTLSSSGTLTISNLTSPPITVPAGSAVAYSGSLVAGAVLGNQNYAVIVTDGGASPTFATATGTLDVVQNRVVATTVSPNFGLQHMGYVASGTLGLVSLGANSQNTAVTVASSTGTDSNGILYSGNNTGTFNGSYSATGTLSGTFATSGTHNGSITLITTGEGLANESPINVTLTYTGTAFSGMATWNGSSNGSWGVNGNWGDTQAGDLGGAGAPGLSGALSVGDTATFGDLNGEGATTTVSLNGANPTLAALTFSSTSTNYTIAMGTSGTLTLQSGAIIAVNSGTATISAVIAGTGGWSLSSTSGTGVLALGGANTFTGGITINSGVLEANALNVLNSNNVTFGAGVAAGTMLVLHGNNTTIGALNTNATPGSPVVENLSATPALLITTGTGTYAGVIQDGSGGGALSLEVNGGVLSLTGSNTYSGSTDLNAGELNLGSANALANSGTISFTGGSLQWSAANTTDYSGRFVTASGQKYSFDTNGQNVTLVTALGGAASSLTKLGAGQLTLSAAPTYGGTTTIISGVLQTPNLLPNSNSIVLNGGVWQPVIADNTTYNFTLGTASAGNVSAWDRAPGGPNGSPDGGFAAFSNVANSGTLTLIANGGAQLTWGSGNFAGVGGDFITFGSTTSNDQVLLTNSINLAATDSFQQMIVVNGTNVGGSALLSGQITQPADSATVNPTEADGLKKNGLGMLILSNTTSNFSGQIFVEQGSLVAAGESNSTVSGANAGGVFGTGTGSPNGTSTTPAAAFNITLGDGNTIANSNPSLYIAGAYWVDRNITAVNEAVGNNTYAVGGLMNASGTFSGTITVDTLPGSNNFFDVTQVATTGNNALNITGAIVSNNGAGESVNFANVGAVNVSGVIAGTGFSVIQSGPGTTTFSNANTYTGSTVVNQGDLSVTNSLGSATGTNGFFVTPNANAPATLSGTGVISGLVTTTSNGGLNVAHIAPGVNTSGNFGGVGTLTLSGGLTLNNGTDLDFDLGTGSGSDLIALTGTTGTLTTGSGIIVNMDLGAPITTGTTYTLIIYSGSLSNPNNNISGWTATGAPAASIVTFTGGSGVVTVTITPNPTPGNAYWGGAYGSGGSGTWNTFVGALDENSNWLSAISSGTDTLQAPGASTNVFFIADTGSNVNTVLGANISINSLNFTGTDATVTTGSAVTIGGSNTLTINATGANGNTAGSGITTGVGAGADLISANVALGGNQTWTLNSSAPLTVTGSISGAHALTVAGSGELILGGNNTFTNGLTINNSATVVLNNTGALNSSAPDSVTFGPSSSGALDLNGHGVEIGNLSSASSATAAVIQDASGTAALLTVNQTSSGTFAGVLRDGSGGGALSLAMAASSTAPLSLTGANTYSGSTIVNGGGLYIYGSLASIAPVTVNSSGTLGGPGGTVHGAVTVNSSGEITATVGTPSAPATLSLANGLTINSGGIAAFNVINGGANDEININGALILNSGAILEVTQNLTIAGTYALMTYSSISNQSLSGITFDNLNGSPVAGNYSFMANSGTLDLVVATVTQAVPSITITAPANNARVMENTGLAVSGTVSNAGTVNPLSGTLSNGAGSLAVGNLTPPPIMVSPGGAVPYSGSVASTGSSLGSQTLSVVITDGSAYITSATATGTVDVLQNRVVLASSVPNYGVVHVGTVVSSTFALTSPGADNQNTRVTVADSGTDAFGISISGGNPSGTFNGSFSDTRTISGTFTGLGNETGIMLATGSEGLAGESPVNVNVGFTAQVFSGKASWAGVGNGSWATNGNWGDTQAPTGTPGAPGLSGALSIGDTATFGDYAGETVGGTTTVSLNGVSPSLAGLTFNASNTTYTIATGSGAGQLSMQSGGFITVSTGTGAITSSIVNAGPLTINGPGTLVLTGSTEELSGSVTIASGTLDINLQNTATGKIILTSATYNTDAAGTLEFKQATSGSTNFDQTSSVVVTGSGKVLFNPNGGDLQVNGLNFTTGLTLTGTGGTVEIASGTLENGGTSGNYSIVWTNNKDSLLLDPGSVFNITQVAVTVDALSGSGTITRLSVGNGANTINMGINNGSGTFTGLITNQLGNVNINKVGTGLEVLTGSNSFGGYAAVSGGGTLRITNGSGLGWGGPSFVTEAGQHTATASGSSTLDIAGGITVNEALTLNNGSLINSAVGTTSVLDSGIAGIDFTTDNAVGASGTAPITVAIGGGATANAGTVSGTTPPLGGGNAQNLYTQMVTAGAGYLPGAAPTVTITQSNTTIGGNATAVVSQLILTGSNNFIGGNGNLTINAQINGAGGFSTVGTGTVTLTNAEIYTGSTGIAAGSTLQLGNGTSGSDGTIATSTGILDNGSLIYNRFGSYTYAGSISGTGSLTVLGSGTQTLAAADTYSGATTISSSSTLQLGSGTTDGVLASGTVFNNGTLLFNTLANENFAGQITGGGLVVMSGAGNQKLSGVNNYTGSTFVNSGTLQVGSTNALGNTPTVTVSSAGSLSLSNGLVPQTITFSGGGRTLTVNSGASLDFGVSNTGADELVISGGAAMPVNGIIYINLSLLSGTGTSTPFTIISDAAGGLDNATFEFGNLPALSSGTSIIQTDTSVSITFIGISTVYWEGGGTSNPGYWGDFSNFTSDAAGTTPISGTFGPTQDVVFSASSGSNQTANLNYLNTSLSAHSLTINDPAGVDIGNANDDTLTLAGLTGTTGINVGSAAGALQAEIDANIDLAGTPNITVNNSGGLLITGIISGSNGILVNGSGLLVLTGPNSYSGGMQLVSGTLNVNDDGNFGQSGSGNGVTFNPGAGNSVTLQSSNSILTTAPNRSFTFNSGTGIIDPGPSGYVMTIGGVVSGTAAFEVIDTGELVLSGSVAFNGAAYVPSGTLALAYPGTLGQTGSSVFNTGHGGVLALEESGGEQNLVPAAGDSVAFTGNGTLLVTGPGILQIHGSGAGGNVYMDMAGGTIEISGGALLQNGGPTPSLAAEGDPAIGVGSPLWTGTYNGTPFTNMSSLQIDPGATFDVWNGNPVYADALVGSGTLTRLGYFNNETGGVVTLGDNNGSGEFDGVITNLYGVLSIVKTGTGTEIFTGSNSYSGSTLVAGGTLRTTSSYGLGFGGPAYLGGNNGNSSTTVTVTGSSTLDLNGGITVDKVIALNNGSLINSGTGTSVLDNGVAAVVLGGAVSGTYVTPSLTGSGGTGSGALFTAGTGTAPAGATVFGEVSSAGTGYTVAPTLSFTDSSGTGAGFGSGVTATAVLSSLTLAGNNNVIGGTGNLTINAQISGVGGFTKTGGGNLILTGSNSYTGTTMVVAGNLIVAAAHGSSTGSGPVNITPNAGGTATFSGNDPIAGLVTTSSTSATVGVAHIAPGLNTNGNFGVAGTLTLSNGLSLGNGTNLDFDLGTSSDLIAVTGPLSLGSNIILNISRGPGFSSGTYTLISDNGTLTGATSGWSATGLVGDTASFSSANGMVTVTITPTSNDSQLSISPVPISVGSVLVGYASSGTAVLLSNTSVNGSGANYTLVTTGSASASPASGSVAANSGATLTVGSGTIGGPSGNNIKIGTVAATNNSNPGGSAAPVNVTANVYEAFSGSAGVINNGGTTTTLDLTTLANDDGMNGQRAGVTITGFNTGNGNFVVTPDNGGTVGTASGGSNSATTDVGTVSAAPNLLNNANPYTYSGTVTGTAQYSDPALQSQGGGSLTNPQWSGANITATVTGHASTGRANIYSAQITSGSTYAGYSLSSGVVASIHTSTGNPSGNGGPSGPTTGSLLAGSASATTTVNMSFDSAPVSGGPPNNPAFSSDILTLTGIAPTGTQTEGGLTVTLTDDFVLQLTYDVSQVGLSLIAQNTGSAWVNAVTLNNAPPSSSAFAGSYTLYLSTSQANGGGQGLSLASQVGAYGYANGAAWAVLDHTTAAGGSGVVAEFAVVPEPSTYAMIFSGFGMLVGFQRLRRRSRERKS